MAFSMAGGGASRPQINVTPLIDVLLTLIIMFMLVVSMDPEYGEKAQIPQPNHKETEQQAQVRTVVIEVISGHDQAPSVKLNQEDVRWEDLEARLARIYLRCREGCIRTRGYRRGLSVCRNGHRPGASRRRTTHRFTNAKGGIAVPLISRCALLYATCILPPCRAKPHTRFRIELQLSVV